jgi:hypothetical protein
MALVSTVMRPGAAKDNPFTVCIVANPALEAPWNSGTVVADPIIGQLPAFQAAATYIDSALFGLLPGQKEVLLADPAIMPFVRVVSVYDEGLAPSLANALVAQDGNSNILVARRSVFVQFLANYHIEADIVYAVSASSSHTRASAWFTSDDDAQGGVPFSLDGNSFFHRYYNVIPGTVGIHVTSDSLTALHEFGHAVSSYTNGKILDLYVESPVGLNNRLGRPIPSTFCNYQSTVFASDPTRNGLSYLPDLSQSYHCALVDPTCPAVMDNYYLSTKGAVACLHDQVTEQFIRDRMAAKISRP